MRESVSMADWKQITARIRRARTSKDPAAQLSNLYEKTKDAMVAFELARFFEAATQLSEAARWYAEAAKHFRRADWKTKAQEAATRLGGAPLTSDEPASDSASPAPPAAPLPVPEPGLPFEQNVAVFRSVVESGAESGVESDTDTESAEASASATSADQSGPANEKPADALKRRRRGRRGGRNRRKPGATTPGAASSTVTPRRTSSHSPSPIASVPVENDTDSVPERSSFSLSPLPVEPLPDGGGIALRGRYGDPGLSSRISLLEMQFRRLLTCQPLGVDSADRAPAGPGVLLLTDSDLTTYYYVESCQTLRIAVANLLRGGSSRRGGDSIKPQLAQHLGITDARVSKYLADHCVVRWLQLDEGASHFAHFVTAILRPVLND
jgi:hypothetical protein